jgi:hypothetical protein
VPASISKEIRKAEKLKERKTILQTKCPEVENSAVSKAEMALFCLVRKSKKVYY